MTRLHLPSRSTVELKSCSTWSIALPFRRCGCLPSRDCSRSWSPLNARFPGIGRVDDPCAASGRACGRRSARRVGQNTFNLCQPLPAKIFHFTEIRKYRMCCPSRLILEGRSCGRHFREPGLRWTRQCRAREVEGRSGCPCEPSGPVQTNGTARFVSPASFRLRRQGWKNCGEMAGRAYGKTVWS